MPESNENKSAREAQEAEMKKIGIKPASQRGGQGEDSESDEDEELEDDEVEDESDDEEEDSEDDEQEEDEDDSENEDDEDDEDEEDEEDDESQSHKKKGIPYKLHNEVRAELRAANQKIQELLDKDSKKVEDVPDDFSKRVDELAKEIGVENPDGLKKIMALVEQIVKGKSSDTEKKLADLEEKYGKIIKSAPIEDHFDKEWKTFSKSFSKEFPDASDEEIEAAQELMNELSHTPNIGGKVYKDADGRKLLDPYELDYIFFKNKDKFSEITSGKKIRGMERNRSQGIDKRKEDKDDSKPLRKGASAKEIEAYSKRSGKIMEGMDNLSEPVDDTI